MRAISTDSSSASCTSLVIQLDGGKRLDEHGLARGARSVDDAVADGRMVAIGGAHWDYVTIIAERDVVFGGIRSASSKDFAQRFLDGIARAHKRSANTAQLGRSVVTDRAIRQNSAANGGRKMAEVRERFRERGKSGGTIFRLHGNIRVARAWYRAVKRRPAIQWE